MQFVVPLAAIPNQQVPVTLGGQQCQINVYQRSTGLYFDLIVPGLPLLPTGKLCRNAKLLVRDAALGFIGDLAFQDTAGTSDPDYTGLGDQTARFLLIYYAP